MASPQPPAQPPAQSPSPSPAPAASSTAPRRTPVRQVLREVTEPGLVHPALIPGIGVERTGRDFSTNWGVFAAAGAFTAGVVAWGILDSEGIAAAGSASLSWVTTNFGWLFGALTVAVTAFMLFVGLGRTGGIRLGADEERPEFSTASWISMLFAAGLGIGLLFYGPLEPLTYFLEPPHGFDEAAGSPDAMHSAMAQTMLHWGPMAWAYYALVGGAIAYGAYRRGRSPLISALFTPIFGQRTEGWVGSVIDAFAIIVTLGGTAISLGIGALQIGRGFEVVSGIGPVGNGFIVGAIALLTCLFIVSAVSGVKRGIRLLSNANMLLVVLLGLFALVTGPTLLLLNLIPATVVSYVEELGTMLVRNVTHGDDAQAFLASWTTYYWAWWVSWTPFVGMFIAKISRGRTLREFVTVVILVPSAVCLAWFTIYGGTSMSMEAEGLGIADAGAQEAVLFEVLANLPLSTITSIVAMAAVVIFFVTAADSASIVMSSISQRGKPEPTTWVTIFWGLLLGATAAVLLVGGGETALGGLQSLMVVTALPFALVVMGIMVAFWRDLSTDPYMLRHRYARTAIAQGVRRGIEEHGDDFVFGASEVEAERGAGAWLDSEDPALTEWYTDATTGAVEVVPDAAAAGQGGERELRPGTERRAIEAGGAGGGDRDGGDRLERDGAPDRD